MSTPTPSAMVMLWAQRILSKRRSPPHELLEIAASASVDNAQDAFHKIARLAHPDLHRHALTPQEIELVTQAYALVAGAYQTFRTQAMNTLKMTPMAAPAGKEQKTPSGGVPVASALSPSASTARQMSSRALVYYRKAELALKQGDLRGAVLQLKMAIAADPASAFLRTALAEVEAEVGRK